MTTLPDADYVVLASRVAPGLDGGFAVAVPARLRLLEAAGAREPLLLSVDGQAEAAHAEQRQQLVDAGALPAGRFRNLFDELHTAPEWLLTAGVPGAPTPGVEYRVLTDAAGAPIVSLPVFADDPEWHLRDAAVVVHAPDGDRVLAGFTGLYSAWLTAIADERRAQDGDPGRVLVVVCESRQLGEALAGWDDPRVRLVHTVHNSHLPEPYDDPAAPPSAPLWRRWLTTLDGYDAVLWPTAAQRDDVAAQYGHGERFHVVPNPIESGDESPDVASRDRRLVVMMNRLAPQKRVDVAIRAWARVVAAVPAARLDIYGDGPLRGELQTLIDDLGLGGSVTLRGATDQRDAIFDRAALLLVSTAFEGQGLAIAEALARGLPVVSTDVRYGPREAVGGAGVLVPPGDADALADAVIALLCDDARRAELSVAAAEAARAFSPDAVRPALVAALTAAVGGPRHPLRALAQRPGGEPGQVLPALGPRGERLRAARQRCVEEPWGGS